MTRKLGAEVGSEAEARHAAGEETLWGESYYMDFVAADAAIGGYIRVGYYPNLGVAWWTAAIVEPGNPTIMSVSFDAPIAGDSVISASGRNFSVDMEVSEPLKALTVRASAVGGSFPDPTAIYRGETGEEVKLEMELSWITDGEPYHYEQTTRYEVPCVVSGVLRIGDRTIAIRGQGQRDHSWGVRDWWSFGWCWLAARLDDGARIHAVEARIPGVDVAFGYVQEPSGSTEIVRSAEVHEDLGPEGLPVGGTAILNGGAIELTIEPLGYGPLLLVSPDAATSRFARAMARFTDQNGRSGFRWVEWNQPQRA